MLNYVIRTYYDRKAYWATGGWTDFLYQTMVFNNEDEAEAFARSIGHHVFVATVD